MIIIVYTIYCKDRENTVINSIYHMSRIITIHLYISYAYSYTIKMKDREIDQSLKKGWIEKNVKEYKNYPLNEIRQFDKIESYYEWFEEYWFQGGQLSFKNYMDQLNDIFLRENM